MFKKLLVFLFCFIVGTTFILKDANAEMYISVDSYLNNLYSISGVSNYAGYNELKGFPNNDKFRIYYSGDSQSFSVKVDDTKDSNEQVTWYYNGVARTNTRKECYSFFASTAYYRSIKTESEILSEKWFKDTFGQVYLDWFDYLCFTDEANRIVDKYLQKLSGKTTNNVYNYHSGQNYYDSNYNPENDV